MGSDNIGGSEHRISGQQFAGELQLIAYNSQLYSNFSEAESGPNGLAAFSLLIQPCNFEHPQPTAALGHLLDIVLALAEKGETVWLKLEKYSTKSGFNLFPLSGLIKCSFMENFATK